MSDYSHLCGHRFPEKLVTLGEHTAALWADVVLADAGPDRAHPSLGYVLAMRGCVSIEEIFELLETDAQSGVLFGECALEFDHPLVPGTCYTLDGEILSVERKVGRRAGAFDRLTFAVRIRERDTGRPVCTNTNTWMIPREEG